LIRKCDLTAVRTELAGTCTTAADGTSFCNVFTLGSIDNVRRKSDNIAAGEAFEDGVIRIDEGTALFTQRTESFWIHIGAAKGGHCKFCVGGNQKIITLRGVKEAGRFFNATAGNIRTHDASGGIFNRAAFGGAERTSLSCCLGGEGGQQEKDGDELGGRGERHCCRRTDENVLVVVVVAVVVVV
jgi:hypothetical protein